jgi:hypothetical protein
VNGDLPISKSSSWGFILEFPKSHGLAHEIWPFSLPPQPCPLLSLRPNLRPLFHG